MEALVIHAPGDLRVETIETPPLEPHRHLSGPPGGAAIDRSVQRPPELPR